MFLSHTSELRRYPERGPTYLEAAERAVSAARHSIVAMADFSAEDAKPARVCQREVSQADVYVGIIGLRYGSPVRDQPEMSYTELEFLTATELGMPRLLFLLDDRFSEHGIPPRDLYGPEHALRQADFRQRLHDSGATVALFRNPDNLQTLLERSLSRLAEVGEGPKGQDRAGPAGKDALWAGSGGAGRGVAAALELLRKDEVLHHLPNRGEQDRDLNLALRQLLLQEQARPITVIAYGEQHQAPEHYFDRFLQVNLPALASDEISTARYDLLWSSIPAGREFNRMFEDVLCLCLPMDLQPKAKPCLRDRLIVLRTDLNSDDWGRRNGAALLEQICGYWAAEQWKGWRIIHWIGIQLLCPTPYERRGLRPRWLRRSYWNHRELCRSKRLHALQIRDRFRHDRLVEWAPSTTVVLRELESVRRSCAEAWANSLEVEKAVPCWARGDLREAVKRFYAEEERRTGLLEVPMQNLANDCIKTFFDTLRPPLDHAEWMR